MTHIEDRSFAGQRWINRSLVVAAAMLSALAVGSFSDVHAGSPEENKALVARYLDAMFNKADFVVTDELVAEDFLDHGNGRVDARTREALKEEVVTFRKMMPDLDVELSHIMADGDLVAYRFVSRGGEGIGKPFAITGIIIDRIEDGQIVERWENYDEVGAIDYFSNLGSQ